MSKFILNGKNYSGSSNNASAITYTKEDGTKSTVQDELDVVNDSLNDLNTNIAEQNKNLDNKADKNNTVTFYMAENIRFKTYNNTLQAVVTLNGKDYLISLGTLVAI